MNVDTKRIRGEEAMARRARDLAESWVNGNRSHVVEEVTTAPLENAPYLGAAVCLALAELASLDEAERFAERLLDRVDPDAEETE